MSALLFTITPRPAVAAALAFPVSEHLGSPRHSQQASYDIDEEDQACEGYDARRPWSSTPSSPRPPQRLWDRYGD